MKYRNDTEFIEKIFNNFDKIFISNLFTILYDEEENIKPKVNIYISNFIDNEVKSELPDKIFNLIKLTSFKNSKIAKKLKNYIFDQDSFFTLEENLKLKLLRLLVIGRILPSDKSQNWFLKTSFEKIEELKTRFNNFKISFNDISDFFAEERNIKIFMERLGLLYLININDKDETGQKYDDNFNLKKRQIIAYIECIKGKFAIIRNEINYIKLIINDLIIFYPISHKKEIEEFKLLIDSYKNKTLLERDKKIEIIIKDYYQEAEARSKIKDSILFKSIYEKEKINFKNDEAKSLIAAQKKFNEVKKVLNLNEIDENLMKLCLEEFKNKTKDEIKNELNKLISFFNVKNINIEDLANNYELLAYKENIIKVAKSIKSFIEEVEVIKSNFYLNLDIIISFSENHCDLEVINMFLELLQNIGIDLKDKECKFINALIALNKNRESIKFLLLKSLAECALLHEIVNNSDNDSFLTSADIINLEKCVMFMKNLGSSSELKKITDYDLIIKAVKLFNELEDKNSDLYFINFSQQYQKIKELLKQEFNKSEALRQKIENICRNSLFILSNKNKNYFEGKYEKPNKDISNKDETKIKKKFKKEIKEFENINFKDLQDLNVRIQITNKLSEHSKEKIKIFEDFINLMKDITSIFYLLNDIYIRGYFKEIKVLIIINNYEKHYEIEKYNPEKENDKNKNEIKKNNIIIKDIKFIYSELKEIKEKLIKSQKEGYKEYEYIRYMFGRHFNILYNYLHTKDDINFVTQFLQYISNNQIKENITDYEWKNKEEDEYKNIIYNFNEFIKQNIENNKLNLEKIYSNSKIFSNDFIGFYLYSCVEKPENQLFQLYKYLTGNTPFSQNILLCHSETSKEEIESFLYRSIFCNYKSCFMIGRIESLEFEQKNYLIELLNKIINEFGDIMKSCLIVLSNNKNTDIHKSIDAIKYRKYFKSSISDEINNYFFDEKDNIQIFSSDKSGVGKSTQIFNSIKKSDYKYFPLGGYLSRDNIFNRLKKLSINENSSIHLDLYETDEVDLMTDFLFEILILKSYRKNEDFFILPNHIKIIIEIPNCFINYRAKFPILNLVPKDFTKELFIEKLSPLNLDENIQIVCNYLKLRKEKKINDNDIIFENITPKELYKFKIKVKNGKKINEKEYLSPLFIRKKTFSEEECKKLIFDVFKENKNDFPSYYQIRAFIDVLAGQLKIFNKSYILNPEDLKKMNYKVVRSFAIEGFINMTRYTIKASYQKLLDERL